MNNNKILILLVVFQTLLLKFDKNLHHQVNPLSLDQFYTTDISIHINLHSLKVSMDRAENNYQKVKKFASNKFNHALNGNKTGKKASKKQKKIKKHKNHANKHWHKRIFQPGGINQRTS